MKPEKDIDFLAHQYVVAVLGETGGLVFQKYLQSSPTEANEMFPGACNMYFAFKAGYKKASEDVDKNGD